jgi:hypothetical protein
MNILKGIKNLFSKKKKVKQNFQEEFCLLLTNQINLKINNLDEKPVTLSEEQWRGVLNKILFAANCKRKSIILKSAGKHKIREKKIKEGFDLLRVYFKEL